MGRDPTEARESFIEEFKEILKINIVLVGPKKVCKIWVIIIAIKIIFMRGAHVWG